MLLLFTVTWGAVSGWWSVACLLLGVLYAWLLYRRPVLFSGRYRWLLAVFRALAVTLIGILLLVPLIQTVKYQPQKPLILIAQDNSESIGRFQSNPNDLGLTINGLAKLKSQLGDDYDVREYHFGADLHPGLVRSFNGKQTNISAALKQLNEQFVNQNIGAIVLATDGIYNQGTDPQYEAQNIKASIYTVPLGDTIPRRDLFITNVSYNKTSLLGNDFEVELQIGANKSSGETARLTVTEDGKTVQSQNQQILSDEWQKRIRLKLNADKKGLRKFTFSLAPLANEISTQNNTQTIYVDVIDARQKILLVYGSPHPDIGVLKQAIELNRNYELTTIQADDAAKIKWDDYNLLILHQVTLSANANLFKAVTAARTPVWFMAGAQSNLSDFNQQQNVIRIAATRQDVQEAFALPDAGFSSFTLSDSTRQKLGALPPLLTAFGSYQANPQANVLFRQKIGAVATTYPLLAFMDTRGYRTAALTGEGLWRWNLSEFQAHGNHHSVEELVSQIIQYLTANAKRQRFNVFTGKNVFDESEHLIVNAELYNEALELVNTPDVKLELKDSNGKRYSYLFSRTGASYQLDAGSLPAGDYSYNASTQLGGRTFAASGQLSIKALDVELRQSTADHALLRSLAKRSGGVAVKPAQIDRLADLLRKNENVKTVLNEDRSYRELIDVKWVFAIILALLSAEWFLRKREGEI